VARVIELNYMKTQCGYQDAYMAVFGGLQYMDFRDKELYRDISREIYATMEPLGEMVPDLPAVVVHTGRQRHSGSVLRPIRERWLEGDRGVVEGYRRIGQLCRQGKRALLDRDWPTLGRLMNENHAVQRELGASGPANDELVERCLHHGCWGAKLAGAGGGGHIIGLHPEPDDLLRRLGEDGYTRVIRPRPSPGLTVSRESH
jgi:galactokinase/mevalonate kinase-like predicted kinase